MYSTRWATLWVVMCLVFAALSQTPPGNDAGSPMPHNNNDDNKNNQSPSPDSGMNPPPSANQKPPVWLECMAASTGEDVGNAGIKDVFETWCSNYDQIVQCLTNDLPASAESNPFDFFIGLDFDADRLREASMQYCGLLKDMSSKLTCASQQNHTLATVCGHAFTRGLIHIYELFKRDNAPPTEVLSQIACDVTTQTTFCLRQTLTECPPEVQTTLINYYALFTNGTCVAGEDYQPPRPNPPPPQTIVNKCAAEASDTLDEDPIAPSSVLDFVILGLETDCKTYPARFACYDRELRNITNFLDFWLSLTFDYNNAMASQEAYCSKIQSVIISKLTSECFNKSHRALEACEVGFGQEVESIRREWVQNPDFDGVQLQTLACRTSVTRAICLSDAMKHCGEDVALEMRKSEMGILPDVCERLLTTPQNGGTTARNGAMPNNRNPNYGTESSGKGVSDGSGNEMGYTKEHRVRDHPSDKDMTSGTHMNTPTNEKTKGGDGGVGVVNANAYVIATLIMSLFLAHNL